MGLGQYVYPRFAVSIVGPGTSTGQAVPIDELRARCLWYPGDGLMVSGHVLYVSHALHEAMLVALSAGEPEHAEVDVEKGQDGVSHRLAESVSASRYASIPALIRAVVERAKAALPVPKRKLLNKISTDPAHPEQTLQQLEDVLHREGLHVLVPLSVGQRYHLFTDATEALMPVSPMVLGRQPRLCFVLLSTDSLIEKREGSPWLRQASELMVLPVNALRVHPDVVRFVADLDGLRAVEGDEHLLWDLATALHQVTGGWPDLCDRLYYERLSRMPDPAALRDWIRELSRLMRLCEHDPVGHCEELLALALGEGPPLPDLPPRSQGSSSDASFAAGPHDALLGLLHRPAAFTWESHGRAYLDGFVGWEQGLAVPRSRVVELALRGRMAGRAAMLRPAESSQSVTAPRVEASARGADEAPGPQTVRWLHVSDFHFKAHPDPEGEIVLEALLQTVADMHRLGRRADLIFVTGDVAFSGDRREYERALSYLNRLCLAAGVTPAQVHIVPGNHDVSRSAGEALVRTFSDARAALRFFEEGRDRPHLAKLAGFREFYDKFYDGVRRAAPGQATAGPEIVQVREVSLGLLPLNSAWFAQDDTDRGQLLIGENVVRGGLAAIAPATLRVSLVHHPVSDLADIERKLIGERLSEGVQFQLRGHLHDTEAGYISTAYQQSLVLAAGAAFQGRVQYQNRALFVEAEVLPREGVVAVRPYPIRYELTGHDRWTLDTSVFPRSYPTYLETLRLTLGKKL